MKDEVQAAPNAGMAQALGLDQKAASRFAKINKWWIAAAAVVVIGAGYLLWPLGEGGPVSYRTAEVKRGTLTVTVTASGTLEPRNQVQIGPEISGLVENVLVDFNSAVTKDQILAQLDTDNQGARVALSRANLAAAKARVEDAKATAAEAEARLKRIQELSKEGYSSSQDLDAQVAATERARAGVAIAEAQVDVAAATLLQDETNLAKTAIKSPIDGVVMLRQVEPGQAVAASLQTPVLFQVAEDLTAMELIVDVDEADIGEVEAGQEAEFTVAAFPARKFPATIRQVRFAPKTVEGVVTYQAVLDVDNSDLALRPGMTATATIVTVTLDDTLLVPNAALRFQPPREVVAAAFGDAAAGGQSAQTERRPPGLLSMFRGPMGGNNQRPSTVTVRAGSQQPIWLLENGKPTPRRVTVGPSDSQVASVQDEGLAEGALVIVGMNTGAQAQGQTQSQSQGPVVRVR